MNFNLSAASESNSSGRSDPLLSWASSTMACIPRREEATDVTALAAASDCSGVGAA